MEFLLMLSGVAVLMLVMNTHQRVSDHLVNIAYSILSGTGSKSEAFAQLEKMRKTATSVRAFTANIKNKKPQNT